MPKDNNNIGIVKKRLWASGYRVQDMSASALGFDLLVEGKHRVCVRKEGTGLGDSDMTAVVSFDAAKRPVVLYTVAGVSDGSISPQSVFGLPESKSKDNGNKKEKARTKSAGKKGGKKAKAATTAS